MHDVLIIAALLLLGIGTTANAVGLLLVSIWQRQHLVLHMGDLPLVLVESKRPLRNEEKDSLAAAFKSFRSS